MVDNTALSQALDDFAATVSGDFVAEDILHSLARAAMKVLDLDGAGVMIAREDLLLRYVFATGGAVEGVLELEQLQEELGAGPCHESCSLSAVLDVGDLGAEGNWPQYQRRAVELGLRAVTALPLQARGRTWGVLDLYRQQPGALDEQELRAARTLANLATSYLVVTADRDTAREAQSQLAHRAMHDPLTGLPLRWVLLEQVGHALSRLARHPQRVGVLFIDLDALKQVNDTFGHPAGDRLLQTSVDRIRAALRPSDVVARLGGDEFVVLLEDLASPDDAVRVAERIQLELRAPYHPDGHLIQPSASIGIATTIDPAQTPDALIAHADSAMYRAKRRGRGRYEVFDPDTYASERADARAREGMAGALDDALHAGQFVLHYQPIVALTPERPARAAAPLYAVEALVRWRHPRLGLLPAAAFIEEAERTGTIVDLGAWVLATACCQLAAWDATVGTRAPSRLFVNISVSELLAEGLVDRIAACLRETGIDPDRLTLEITETGLFRDPTAVASTVTALLEIGCHVAIDDFGTGWSSLGRLMELPASTLKVDRSFTIDLTTSPDATSIVSAVMWLGGRLSRTVIVEGVEDQATLDALQDMGCTHAQGYRLAVPQPPEDLRELLVRG